MLHLRGPFINFEGRVLTSSYVVYVCVRVCLHVYVWGISCSGYSICPAARNVAFFWQRSAFSHCSCACWPQAAGSCSAGPSTSPVTFQWWGWSWCRSLAVAWGPSARWTVRWRHRRWCRIAAVSALAVGRRGRRLQRPSWLRGPGSACHSCRSITRCFPCILLGRFRFLARTRHPILRQAPLLVNHPWDLIMVGP